MVSARTWELIERQKLRGRDRRTRHHRPDGRPDPSRPVGTDMLPRIKHIIVLIGENRGLDHTFGVYKPKGRNQTISNLLSKGM